MRVILWIISSWLDLVNVGLMAHPNENCVALFFLDTGFKRRLLTIDAVNTSLVIYKINSMIEHTLQYVHDYLFIII